MLLKKYDISRFVGAQVSHVFVLVFGCGLKREPCCCCLCGGCGVSLFFVAPFSLLAVFSRASAFNQNVSAWNTGAVTNMYGSKCTLSPSLSLCGHGTFRCGVVLLNIYDNSRFVESHVSHVLFFFICLWFETGTLLLLFVWWVSFFFVAPFSLLAVFSNARAFNQDVSKWNTGAVTDMVQSKCTLSSSLLATAPSVVECC